MPLTSQSEPVSIDRLTYRSSTSFEAAEGRLRSSIQKDPKWFQFQTEQSTKTSQPSPPTSKESFEAFITPQLGPHGFMYFTEFDHGRWLSFYKPPTVMVETGAAETGTLRAIRFILGNPLIALTMLCHDLDAGLCVPVELYLVEEAEPHAGVRIVWYRPSGLIAGYQGAKGELVEAAKVLDAKLEALVRWVLEEETEHQGVGQKRL